ncbi:MAG: MoxR family ATPase [Sandaracinaceae bacterium]|nr:MoxR family ATPase [Sandaracinaceae bacterium]
MSDSFGRFRGTATYLTNDALEAAVNCALVLQRPLLVKGEPGTGKTLLAEAIAEGLGLAFDSAERSVLLIDEVDKADLEFPNDLLHELDRMRFTIAETGDHVIAKHRPVVIITSNNEKELPDAFLRRCVFHFIDFPEPELMKRIVGVHHPELDARLLDQAMTVFYEIRSMKRLRKRPSTSELIDWIAVLKASGIATVKLESKLPFLGALLKKEQDLVALADQISGGPRYRS